MSRETMKLANERLDYEDSLEEKDRIIADLNERLGKLKVADGLDMKDQELNEKHEMLSK